MKAAQRALLENTKISSSNFLPIFAELHDWRCSRHAQGEWLEYFTWIYYQISGSELPTVFVLGQRSRSPSEKGHRQHASLLLYKLEEWNLNPRFNSSNFWRSKLPRGHRVSFREIARPRISIGLNGCRNSSSFSGRETMDDIIRLPRT